MSDTLRIYSFPLSGHSHRVVLFANLAGIAHEVIKVDLATGEHKQAPYLTINPLGQVPAIQDGEATICDSNAILVYLARKYAPQYLPTDLVLEAEVQKFLTVAAGELMYGACAARLITVFNGPFDPAFTASVAEAYLGRMEAHLAGRDYLVGESPTIADVALYTYTAHAPEGSISLEAYPNVRRWLATIEALDGFVPMIETKVGLRA